MAPNSNTPQPSAAAEVRDPEPHMLIRELTTFHTRHFAQIPPVLSEMGVRYHRFLDQMRGACLYALAHPGGNKTALMDLGVLEPRFGQQVMGAKSLRFCSSSARMSEGMETWRKLSREQTFKGGPNTMMYLYGVEGWEELLIGPLR